MKEKETFLSELHEVLVLQLPLTRRAGRSRAVMGRATVLDDSFARCVLSAITWNSNGNYATANIKDPHGRWRTVYQHRFIYEHYHGQTASGLALK